MIHGEYIIHFSANYTLDQHNSFMGYDVSSHADFRPHKWLPGYRAKLDDRTFHELVRRDPGVVFVENNQKKYLVRPVNQTESEPPSRNITHPLDKRYEFVTIGNAPWNIRMTGAAGKLKTPVKGNGEVDTLEYSGAGVNIYILDSGIRTTHKLFQGRAFNFKNMKKSPYTGEPMDDTIGHGTHVAGIAGALTYGVAEWATLVNVKVVDKNYEINEDQLARAINDVTEEHKSLKKDPFSPTGYLWRGGVINMSIAGGSYAKAVEDAILNAMRAGLPIVVSAGNRNIDASVDYPCAFAKFYQAIKCVGSVDNRYEKSDFSNFGGPVQLAAPGSDIVSLGHESDVALVEASGTSMAAPHVAGIVANIIYWEGFNRGLSDASRALRRMLNNAYFDIITGFPASTSLFASTGIKNPKKKSSEPVSYAYLTDLRF